jgi:hypothetical protein
MFEVLHFLTSPLQYEYDFALPLQIC